MTTGLGQHKRHRIAPEQVELFNRQLIDNHRIGQGAFAPADVVRATMVRLANGFAKGTTGVRPELAQRLVGGAQRRRAARRAGARLLRRGRPGAARQTSRTACSTASRCRPRKASRSSTTTRSRPASRRWRCTTRATWSTRSRSPARWIWRRFAPTCRRCTPPSGICARTRGCRPSWPDCGRRWPAARCGQAGAARNLQDPLELPRDRPDRRRRPRRAGLRARAARDRAQRPPRQPDRRARRGPRDLGRQLRVAGDGGRAGLRPDRARAVADRLAGAGDEAAADAAVGAAGRAVGAGGADLRRDWGRSRGRPMRSPPRRGCWPSRCRSSWPPPRPRRGSATGSRWRRWAPGGSPSRWGWGGGSWPSSCCARRRRSTCAAPVRWARGAGRGAGRRPRGGRVRRAAISPTRPIWSRWWGWWRPARSLEMVR